MYFIYRLLSEVQRLVTGEDETEPSVDEIWREPDVEDLWNPELKYNLCQLRKCAKKLRSTRPRLARETSNPTKPEVLTPIKGTILRIRFA